MDVDIQKIVSMIVQNLRTKNQTELIDMIKKADYTFDFLEHDNWNGGIDYYRLQFHLQYSDFSKCLPHKEQYEQLIEESLSLFYKDEQNIITGIEIIAKVEQILDWDAITSKYTKESLKKLLDEEKDILIKVGTGIIKIKDTGVNEGYKKIHIELVRVLQELGIKHVSPYTDLWEWFNDYKKQSLDTYQSRRVFINEMYNPLYTLLDKSAASTATTAASKISPNASDKNTTAILSSYLKENSGFDCPFGHIEISISDNLGQGGNGIVYLGKYENTSLAIKFLVNYNSKKLSRFKAEYLNVSIVRNKLKNIVNYIAYGELGVNDSTFPYIIMEVYKVSLKQYRKNLPEIPFSRVLDLFYTLCKALETFEDQKIIHRDLKPENILVDEKGDFYITDFGISHFSSENFPINGLTKKGERLANFEFSAPEQIQGKEVSFATDIYALFQLIYWFVFDEINRGTGGKYLTEVFDNPEASYLDSLIYKGISNSPSDRYQSISEIYEAFDTLRYSVKETNPFDDMHILSDIVRSTVPEFYHKAASIKNSDDIQTLIKKINSAKTHRPFEFNTGTSNNTIDRFIPLDNGNYLLNQRELHIEQIWGYIGDSTYNDILLIETSVPKPYIVDGHEEYAVAVIEKTDIVPISNIESGYIRYKGNVVPTRDLQIQERYIFAHDKDKFIALGSFLQCSVIKENDQFISKLQENTFLVPDNIIELRNEISRKKARDILMYL